MAIRMWRASITCASTAMLEGPTKRAAPRTTMRDYYAVLEVDAGATAVQIRRAYQRLARRYSPDVNFWERDARALFEEIVEAYRILSDATARSLYDRQDARPAGRYRR